MSKVFICENCHRPSNEHSNYDLYVCLKELSKELQELEHEAEENDEDEMI